MDPALVVRGVAIGFGVAAAVGPISLLVLRRALQRGFAYGLASGLGVATADATYGGIAAFGLTVVTEALVGIQRPLAIVGGAFLIVLGARSILAPPATAAARETLTGNTIASAATLAAAYGSILALTLTNPMTILSFAAIFAGVGVVGAGATGAAAITIGVFAGSALWWLALNGGVAAVRDRLTPRVLRVVTVGSGLLVMAFGVLALLAGVRG